MTALSQPRAEPASAFLSVGSRPFFLLAAIWAAAAVPLWLLGHPFVCLLARSSATGIGN